MVSKNQEEEEVLPSSNSAQPTTNADEESAAQRFRDVTRRKSMKTWIMFIAVFVLIQVILWVTVDLTILRVRRPKYRLETINITNLNTNNSTTSASFDMALNPTVTFKNQNFGPYEFQRGYMTFSYKGTPVGEAVIDTSTAKKRSTKRIEIMLNISSRGVPRSSNLGNDIESGSLVLTSESKLRGQVEFVKVLKKDKEAIMKCTMRIRLLTKIVEELKCD